MNESEELLKMIEKMKLKMIEKIAKENERKAKETLRMKRNEKY